MRRQLSVGQALKRFETPLGTQLIDRSPSHFRVTPAGQRLNQECLDLFGSLARAIQSAQGTEDIVSGMVKLAVLSRAAFSREDEIAEPLDGASFDTWKEVAVEFGAHVS